MKCKKGVTLYGLQLSMRKVLICADTIWRHTGRELVITETVGGVHSPGSLHPYGYAVDLRTRYFTQLQKKGVVKKLRELLPSNYRVIEHPTHIHVEDRTWLMDYNATNSEG